MLENRPKSIWKWNAYFHSWSSVKYPVFWWNCRFRFFFLTRIFDDICIVTWAQRRTTSVQLLQIGQRCYCFLWPTLCTQTLGEARWAADHLDPFVTALILRASPSVALLPFPLHNRQELSQNKQDLTEEHNSQHSLFSPWGQDKYYHSHFTNRERENYFPPALSTQSMAACQEEIPRLLYSCWKSHGHGDKWSCQ